MRVFIAVSFEESIKTYLKEIQDEIRLYCNKGNFSYQENFHLTLRFIGEINKEKVPKIQKAIDKTTEGSKSFKLNLNKLGSFERQNEHIVWIGLSGELLELNDLYNKLGLELEHIGIPVESRSLKPHVTLGRRIKLNDVFENIKQKVSIDEKLILVQSITLMESSRINGKLTYTPIYEKKLSNKE